MIQTMNAGLVFMIQTMNAGLMFMMQSVASRRSRAPQGGGGGGGGAVVSTSTGQCDSDTVDYAGSDEAYSSDSDYDSNEESSWHSEECCTSSSDEYDGESDPADEQVEHRDCADDFGDDSGGDGTLDGFIVPDDESEQSSTAEQRTTPPRKRLRRCKKKGKKKEKKLTKLQLYRRNLRRFKRIAGSFSGDLVAYRSEEEAACIKALRAPVHMLKDPESRGCASDTESETQSSKQRRRIRGRSKLLSVSHLSISCIDLPAFLICPITQDLLRDPVICPEGHTFEREAIVQWLSQTPQNPLTRRPLTADQLISNRSLKQCITLLT